MIARQIRVVFWLRCSKQTEISRVVSIPRGCSEERKKDLLDEWTERVHPHCTGTMSYGWRRKR